MMVYHTIAWCAGHPGDRAAGRRPPAQAREPVGKRLAFQVLHDQERGLQFAQHDVPVLDLERRPYVHLEAKQALSDGMFGVLVDRHSHELTVHDLHQHRTARDDVVLVPAVLIQHEHVDPAAGAEQQVLLAVEHERLRRRAEAADLGVPQALAGGGVPGLDVLSVAQEQDPAGG